VYCVIFMVSKKKYSSNVPCNKILTSFKFEEISYIFFFGFLEASLLEISYNSFTSLFILRAPMRPLARTAVLMIEQYSRKKANGISMLFPIPIEQYNRLARTQDKHQKIKKQERDSSNQQQQVRERRNRARARSIPPALTFYARMLQKHKRRLKCSGAGAVAGLVAWSYD
jgi:hypothetical protein